MENVTEDYYAFIGVKRNATSEEIRHVSDELLTQYQVDSDEDVQASILIKHIFEIKGILLDSEKREAYDRLLNERDKEAEIAKAEEKYRRENKVAEKRRSGKISFCDYCGDDFSMLFHCHRCGGKFCVEHHLPESHECPIIWISEAKYESVKQSPIPVQEKPMCPIKKNSPRCYDNLDCEHCDDPEVKAIRKREAKERDREKYDRLRDDRTSGYINVSSSSKRYNVKGKVEQGKKNESLYKRLKKYIFGD
jgi:AN1-like Zinc finger